MGAFVGNKKILGLLELFAAAVLISTLFISAFTKTGFVIGTTEIAVLGSEMLFKIGLLISAVLCVVCCLLALSDKSDRIFIGSVERVIGIVSSAVLVAVAVTEFEYLIYLLFQVTAVAAVVSSVAFSWVTDRKSGMAASSVFAVLLTVSVAFDLLAGLAFMIFLAVWLLCRALFIVAYSGKSSTDVPAETPVAPEQVHETASAVRAEHSVDVKIHATPKDSGRIQGKPAEPIKKENMSGNAKHSADIKISATPKDSSHIREKQPESVKTEEQLPKLRVMSSRDAARALEAKEQKMDSIRAEKVFEEALTESDSEKTDGPNTDGESQIREKQPESVKTEEDFNEDSEDCENIFEIVEDTPDVLVRRAAWNKGLRCRRSYGEHNIPVAFVKGRVAVYITPFDKDTSSDAVLESEGWTVLRFDESDITDGKDQGEMIFNAVKSNIRSDKAAATKKKKKKS